MMTPMSKTMHSTTMAFRRPSLSAKGAPIRTPIAVPTLRRETTTPSSQGFQSLPPTALGLSIVAKRARKSDMAVRPEICPVSVKSTKCHRETVDGQHIAARFDIHFTALSLNLPQPKRKPPIEASIAMKIVRAPIGVPRTWKTILLQQDLRVQV